MTTIAYHTGKVASKLDVNSGGAVRTLKLKA